MCMQDPGQLHQGLYLTLPTPSHYLLMSPPRVSMCLLDRLLLWEEGCTPSCSACDCVGEYFWKKCMCMYGCSVRGRVACIVHVEVREKLTQELALVFHHVGSRDPTLVIRLGGRPLYPLSHLAKPIT